MFKFIDRLRKKPERKREGIVLAVSFSITLVIVLFWIVALVMKIQNGGFSFAPSDADMGRINKSAETLKGSWDSFLEDVNGIVNSPTTTQSDAEGDIQ